MADDQEVGAACGLDEPRSSDATTSTSGCFSRQGLSTPVKQRIASVTGSLPRLAVTAGAGSLPVGGCQAWTTPQRYRAQGGGLEREAEHMVAAPVEVQPEASLPFRPPVAWSCACRVPSYTP
ncbi:hypothetical protein [Kitasatospora sp. NPDC051914]|uniref:hypothetical protein n=1 Tax=Kitasatospora sp. NPDC051914 TaxID=3154945 RepID=UPI00341ED6BA